MKEADYETFFLSVPESYPSLINTPHQYPQVQCVDVEVQCNVANLPPLVLLKRIVLNCEEAGASVAPDNDCESQAMSEASDSSYSNESDVTVEFSDHSSDGSTDDLDVDDVIKKFRKTRSLGTKQLMNWEPKQYMGLPPTLYTLSMFKWIPFHAEQRKSFQCSIKERRL